MTAEIGKVYLLKHSRFGRAVVKVTAISGEWIDVLIVSGKLVGLCDQWQAGDFKTVRAEHCSFSEQKVVV